ncbi:MAG TPA: D-alanyl-D-alanine carboxypeptidase [Candidatus Avilachnospira avistercoris]|nr:D-alanyl-D-alanine carboxypeptidase [Candidatus Avilachnospira avistercoris]
MCRSGFGNRILSFILMLIILVPNICGTVFAAVPWPEGCYVASEGACLIDADSGVVLYGQNENTAFYPASITKVMTALLTLENCEDLTEMVTFSREAVNIEEDNATIIGASEGDRLTVMDCLYSLLFQSANEVANALAEHVGSKHPELKQEGDSDRDVFVRMMNAKAAELGCTNTHFNNPSGLTDPDHYTTPYDMCLIMAAACNDARFVDIESHTYWTHAPIKRYPDPDDPWNTVYPKHSMLKRNSDRYYEGAFAGKTGYTMTSGNTLVTACERNGMRLIVTVMNAHNNHYNDTMRLFDYGYDNFESLYVNDYDDAVAQASDDLSIGGISVVEGVTLGIDPDCKVTIPRGGDFSEISKALEISEDGSASIIYRYGDRVVGSSELETVDFGSAETMKEAMEDPLFNKLMASSQAEELGTMATIGSAEAAPPEGTLPSTEAGAYAAEASSGAERQLESGYEAAAAGEEEPKLSGITRIIILILAGCALIFGAMLFINLQLEKREAKAREKRRRRRLRHTRDMTGQQNVAMDMLVQQSLRKNKRKRKRY